MATHHMTAASDVTLHRNAPLIESPAFASKRHMPSCLDAFSDVSKLRVVVPSLTLSHLRISRLKAVNCNSNLLLTNFKGQ